MSSSMAAYAQIYTCKDASGRTITSDRIMPECANREVQEHGKSGVLKRSIAAPLTAEEKRQRQLAEEKKQAELAAIQSQKKNDRALLARFSTEDDIALARNRSLEVIQVPITRGKSLVDSLTKERKQVQTEVDAYLVRKAKIPTTLQYRLDQAEHNLQLEIKSLKENEAEIEVINAKYDQMLKRFRELISASSSR